MKGRKENELAFPFPDALDEGLATDVVPSLSLLSPDLLLDDHLRRDARVVAARVPEHLLATHPVPATIEHTFADSLASFLSVLSQFKFIRGRISFAQYI